MKVLNGDCFELIKDVESNSIDLVITSPPYADVVSYGKNIKTKSTDDYVDWLLPLFNEIYRVLKPSGSFILNIADKVETGKKLRSTYIFDLISRNNKETELKLYDTYFWYKKNAIPNGSNKRLRTLTEYIFHFVKDPDKLKFNMERILEPIKQTTIDRMKTPMGTNYLTDENGIQIVKKKYVNNIGQPLRGPNGTCNKYYFDENGVKQLNPNFNNRSYEVKDVVRPDNVFRFSTGSSSRMNKIRHPAVFNKELPSYFIKMLTDENDIVLDTFSGIGTTGVACKELNRNYIGFEMNKLYYDYSLDLLKLTNIKL